jgi:hypothetical protein
MQPTTAEAHALLAYAGNVLDQALALAAAHEAPDAPAFAGHVGPHLRHVIEHYESLLGATGGNQVDYDRRERDPALERSPALARQRIRAIQQRLGQWPAEQLAAPLGVRGNIGLAGECSCAAASSFGRELLFVASHAVHHFALLQAHCRQHGIPIGADFGKAPATVAHERARAASTAHDTHEETPCPMPSPAA